jgi:protein-L-isoaspartate(D-aspartate) O-methyltransferase
MRLSSAEHANQRMVDRLIAEGALWSPPLVAAFRATPRHSFLDRVFQYQRKSDRWREIITREPDAQELQLLYSDRALITRLASPGQGRALVPVSSSTQPSLMAQMLEDIKLQAGNSVLEVGAGTGYNAALLSYIVGPGLVTSVEVDREVLAEAWDHLRKFPDRTVALKHADGRSGHPQSAPFDRIMVTAATPDLEPAWLEQLADKGLLVAPLALASGLAYIVRGTVTEGIFHGRLTRAAYFMPLRTEDEAGPSDLQSVLPSGDLPRLKAPWAGWFDRRRSRSSWLGFSQSMAFLGFVQRLGIHYRVGEDGQPFYGVSRGDSHCWFGPREWQVNGEGGRMLGFSLWEEFLDAGGPWPTEFRLRAAPRGGLRTGPRAAFIRQGERCQQLWELPESRDRPGWF